MWDIFFAVVVEDLYFSSYHFKNIQVQNQHGFLNIEPMVLNWNFSLECPVLLFIVWIGCLQRWQSADVTIHSTHNCQSQIDFRNYMERFWMTCKIFELPCYAAKIVMIYRTLCIILHNTHFFFCKKI